MDSKLFLLKFLPILVILAFLKGFFTNFLNFLPLDLYSALALSLIPLLSLSFFSFLALMTLSLLKGVEGKTTTFLWLFLYSFLFIVFLRLKKSFQTETLRFRVLFLALSLLFVLLIKLFFFFGALSLSSLSYKFWVNFIVKTLFYYLFSTLALLGFYFLWRRLFT